MQPLERVVEEEEVTCSSCFDPVTHFHMASPEVLVSSLGSAAAIMRRVCQGSDSFS